MVIRDGFPEERLFQAALHRRRSRGYSRSHKDKSKKVWKYIVCSLRTHKSQRHHPQLQQLCTAQLQGRPGIQTVIWMVKSRVERFGGWVRVLGTGKGGVARNHGRFHFHFICCLGHQYGIVQQTLVEHYWVPEMLPYLAILVYSTGRGCWGLSLIIRSSPV